MNRNILPLNPPPSLTVWEGDISAGNPLPKRDINREYPPLAGAGGGKRVFNFAAYLILFSIFILLTTKAKSQPSLWISYPSANQTNYGVFHFRKSIDLERVPDNLTVHVSADNRYNLFVNGQRISYGPAKGDLQTYKYDVIDIAPFLHSGENVLAALVYNGGADKPLAFLSVQTAFMLRAADDAYSHINTGKDWKVYRNPAYEVISYQEMLFDSRWFYGFYACGGGDDVDGAKYPWGWESLNFDDSHWVASEPLHFDKKPPWNLVPRNLPWMDDHIEYPARIDRTEGLELQPMDWNGQSTLNIPAHSSASILVDFDRLTMGYPELTVSGGNGGSIQVKYAEALYEEVNLKAHRDSVIGKTMFGVWDVFRPDGEERTYRPLWKRCFRYVQFNIQTGNEPLDIVSYQNEYSGYPYLDMATFESDNDKLNNIFTMSQRTLAMCSGETYYDTPFYEQLSYGGDNRPITALSTYTSTDDRLLREVLRLYPQSENKETGLFKSAYPSRFDFDMGSWSMAWIQTLYDYYLIRGDSAFVAQFADKIDGVLGFFERHLDEETGLIGTVANQNFMDWSITKGNLPRKNEDGEMVQSVLLSLNFAHTLDCASSLYRMIGMDERARYWESLSGPIKAAAKELAWNEDKRLFSDYPDKQIYSQHTNLFAILCDVIPTAQQQQLMNRILTFEEFDEVASSYFSFFLFKAMVKTGLEDEFLGHLDFWYGFLETGHTTCGETGFASHDRSDCHAWSAHPAYYLLSIVCGIESADIGFNKVKITPHLGELKNISASMPHPNGRIEVKYSKNDDILNAKITLPDGLSGSFEYSGEKHELKSGENNIQVGG